jgi:hypothetical protein
MEFSRRNFLVRSGLAIAGGLWTTACAGGDDAPSGSSTEGAQNGDPQIESLAGLAIVQRFPTAVLATGAQRMPISLGGGQGSMQLSGPASITAEVRDEADATVATVTATKRSISEGTPPFWVFRTELSAPGIYQLHVDGMVAESGFFQVFQPEEVTVPGLGDPLPPFDTPTVDDPRGVDPYCSRLEGPCPFHDVTLREALAAGTPMLYLVGTPAHCSTGTCAPGLEFVIDAVGERNDVTVVHADVFADTAGTILAPAVEALQLSYEPVLFVCDATGTVVERLDAVWDRAEVEDALALVS